MTALALQRMYSASNLCALVVSMSRLYLSCQAVREVRRLPLLAEAALERNLNLVTTTGGLAGVAILGPMHSAQTVHHRSVTACMSWVPLLTSTDYMLRGLSLGVHISTPDLLGCHRLQLHMLVVQWASELVACLLLYKGPSAARHQRSHKVVHMSVSYRSGSPVGPAAEISWAEVRAKGWASVLAAAAGGTSGGDILVPQVRLKCAGTDNKD
jgi:hypothetical protein